MPDNPPKAPEKVTQSPSGHHRARGWMPESRRSRLLLAAVGGVCVLFLVACLIPAISPLGRRPVSLLKNLPILGRLAGSETTAPLDSSLAPVIGGGSSHDLFSPPNLLDKVGKSPGDGSRSPSPESERAALAPEMRDVAACPPGQSPARIGEPGSRDAITVRTDPSRPEEPTTGSHTPQLVETPVVVTKEPVPEETVRGKRERASKRKKQEKVAAKSPDLPADKAVPAGDAAADKGAVIEAAARKEPADADIVSKKPAEVEIGGKPEQYELPGSLTVNIKNYRGAKVKWGLVVIMDDAAAMGLKSKTWEPNKMRSAVDLVGRLAGSLTPGSRVAVRDFYCKGQDQKKTSLASPCMSRVFYGWAELPLQGLKEKLADVGTAGQTNPCAAAAYSLKADFSGLGELTRRILVVTGGAKKCAYKEVLKEIERQGGTGKVRVDVAGLGINRKRESGYSTLAGKTGGIFFKLEKPADVDSALARYAKALKTPVEKTIQVRGEKTNIKIAEGEEVTLAPGSYSIILPAIQGLDGSYRTVKDVKIAAGQPKILNVAVKKGRAVVGTGKK